MKDNPEYFELLKTPKLDDESKKELIHEAFADTFSESFLNFLKIVIDKKRSDALLDIKRVYDAKMDAHDGVVKAVVESVIPLTAEQEQALAEKLQAMSGKKVVLTSRLNPELLGGLVVQMGDQIIDGSVKFKLQNMLEGLTQIII